MADSLLRILRFLRPVAQLNAYVSCICNVPKRFVRKKDQAQAFL